MSVRFDPSAPYEVEDRDIAFARPGGVELLARVYRPRGTTTTPLAALVDVHGGAWSRLDRTAGVHHGRGLAACGLVVISVDFRQGPSHKHPAAAQDVSAGIRWTRANAASLGIDPARVGLIGQSSGGHLALLVAVKPGAGEHAGTPIVRPDGSAGATSGDDSVRCVMACYPVADPLARYRFMQAHAQDPGYPNAPRLLEAHLGYFPDEAAMGAASVTAIVADAPAVPPAWVAQPEQDDNVPADITDALVHAWDAAGGHVERVRFPGARHGFMQQESADTAKAIAGMRDFAARYLVN